MVKPITPAEIAKKNAEREFPPYVIEAFNNMIAQQLRSGGKVARFSQKAVVEEILKCAFHGHGIELARQTIFDEHLLDVEDAFRAQGWKVEYEKGAYYEPDSYFYFEWKGK